MSQPLTAPVVLDASAILALVRRELGETVVRDVLDRSRVSVINWAEVMEAAIRESLDLDHLRTLLLAGLRIEPLTVAQAELAAGLRFNVRLINISLADCCCLALSHEMGATVYTADREWANVGIDVEVRVIR